MVDMNLISHPSHYVKGRKYEPWDVIVDWDLDYLLGSCMKYISRCGRKTGNPTLQDLYKAREYLNKKISVVEEQTDGITTIDLKRPEEES